MNNLWNTLVAAAAGISDAETQVARRGFEVRERHVARRLEDIGRHFVWGYNRALHCAGVQALAEDLAKRPLNDVGFSYEGAGMGLAVRDWLTPWGKLLGEYIAGPARHHEYMAWVGAGWAFARLPVSPLRALERGTGITRWLALDGYGFHQGYFRWREFIVEGRRPKGLCGESLQVFDQGLGRSLWFVKGADPVRVGSQIVAMDFARHADLWAGVGLACAYAGGASQASMSHLGELAGGYFPAFAQGVVFAAEARRRAGNPAAHTEAACQTVLGMDAVTAADIAIACIPEQSELADYRAWREAIQDHFTSCRQR